jgi:hypothetical protein
VIDFWVNEYGDDRVADRYKNRMLLICIIHVLVAAVFFYLVLVWEKGAEGISLVYFLLVVAIVGLYRNWMKNLEKKRLKDAQVISVQTMLNYQLKTNEGAGSFVLEVTIDGDV